MLRIFIGVDSRARIAFHLLAHSIMRRASQPVSITPLILETLPITRRGLTSFTFSRWLVPWLCNYEGRALFLDSDIIVNCDVAEIFAYADDTHPLHVVKHTGRLTFERPSVVLFNNALCKHLTPEYVETSNDLFAMAAGEDVGELPPEYNFLVGYQQPTDPPPKVIHYTQGEPWWPETKGSDYADLFNAELDDLKKIVSWNALMGNSVHAPYVMERLARERATG